MKRTAYWVLAGLLAAGIVISGCSAPAPAAKEEAVHVEKQDSGLSVLTLSQHAAERLGVQTGEVREDGTRTVIPYAAIIYDKTGATWAYATSEPLVFQRAAITVETISGDEAVLSDGPPAGTLVVTVGAAELYGAETGVGGGH
ncbi:MAG TPA: hypothetical protein VH720_10190 [Candidatus Limnocylindrales bacterium]|jgi:hypothetical protein